MSERRDAIIRASEIGQYTYCARAWWLGNVQGLPSRRRREMVAGTLAHWRHGRRVRSALWLARMGYALLALSVVTALAWLWQLLVG